MDKEHRMMSAKILQSQGLTQLEIAEQLGVCERTVRNYLKHDLPEGRKRPKRASKLDSYRPFIEETIGNHPTYNGEVLYERLKAQGYTGHISIMRDFTAAVRKKIQTNAVIRFETEPGFQAQVDWKEFGEQTVSGRRVKLYAFVMVLGYSRKCFVHFTTSMDESTLLACHTLAFDYFNGVPKEILYDNMKTAWHYDQTDGWKANKRLLALAATYGFTPRRCRVRRPETKGKVERTVGYLDNNFWTRIEGEIVSLTSLNGTVRDWLVTISGKPIAGIGESRAVRFQREKQYLTPFAPSSFEARSIVLVMVNRESTIRYRTNTYSVPPEFIGQLLTLKIDPLTREVDLFAGERFVRRFILAYDGEKEKVMFLEDTVAIHTRWKRDRDRVAFRRTPKKRCRTIEVDVRSPSVYEQYVPANVSVEAVV
jgi:transposase